MPPLDPHHLVLLEKSLGEEFVPYLPPLLDLTRPADEQSRKNLSRAFSAFALTNVCGIPATESAASVIDDFDDHGVDAIYYHAASETVYLVQAKLKTAGQFQQQEALALGQGIRLLIRQDFDTFNQNVQNRKVEIEDALDNCNFIQVVIAHIDAGISEHAKQALDELLTDEDHGEERLKQNIIDYDSSRVVQDLSLAKAYEKVNTDLWLHKCTSVEDPRLTYFGLIQVEDLVKLHETYGKALYERNIRTFLGHTTDVNAAIRQTLATNPHEFLYLNNGVTALCEIIEPKAAKASKGGRKRLKLRGFSVINGAQTIASSAKFVEDNGGADISSAKVSLTLIKAYSDGEFGKLVTRARNYQNPVLLSNFAALDDEQERLRREISYLGFHYAYKAEAPAGRGDASRIRIDEAAQALALLQTDPRYVVWLKKEPARLLDTASEQYKAIFNSLVTPFQLVNAVLFYRYIQRRMANETLATYGLQRLTYKHGNYALGWVLAKRLRTTIQSNAVIDRDKLKTSLSGSFDVLRNTLWNKTQPATRLKGPLALFRNQTDTIPVLREVLITNYDLVTDPVVAIKQAQHRAGEAYPEALFDYITSKAPQIVIA